MLLAQRQSHWNTGRFARVIESMLAPVLSAPPPWVGPSKGCKDSSEVGFWKPRERSVGDLHKLDCKLIAKFPTVGS
jgi:hypothetical protein